MRVLLRQPANHTDNTTHRRGDTMQALTRSMRMCTIGSTALGSMYTAQMAVSAPTASSVFKTASGPLAAWRGALAPQTQVRHLSKLKQKKLKAPKYVYRLRTSASVSKDPHKKYKLKNRKAAVGRWIVLRNGNFARRQAGRGHGNMDMSTSKRLAKRRRVLAHGWHLERLRRLMPYYSKRYMQSR